MNNGLLFYIIVVSSHAGDKLSRTVESALSQSYGTLRVIVQDACSTDDSVESLRMAHGDDGRLVIRTEQDSGIYDAMNRAVQAAAADAFRTGVANTDAYVLFLNCGDLFFDRDVLKRAAKRITAVRNRMMIRAQVAPSSLTPDICYGDTYERKTGQVVPAPPGINDFAAYRNLPCHQSCFYRLALLAEEPFESKWRVRADYEQFLRLRYRRHASILNLKMTVADYEGGGFSETAENDVRSEQERREIISMYLPREKVLRYDLYRTLTLQPLRKKLAEDPRTAGAYQRVKRAVYRRKSGEQT